MDPAVTQLPRHGKTMATVPSAPFTAPLPGASTNLSTTNQVQDHQRPNQPANTDAVPVVKSSNAAAEGLALDMDVMSEGVRDRWLD